MGAQVDRCSDRACSTLSWCRRVLAAILRPLWLPSAAEATHDSYWRVAVPALFASALHAASSTFERRRLKAPVTHESVPHGFLHGKGRPRALRAHRSKQFSTPADAS